MSFRLQLLRHSFKGGWRQGLKFAFLMARGEIGSRRFLVFARDRSEAPDQLVRPSYDLRIVRCAKWDEIPRGDREAVLAQRRSFWWDNEEWLARGWHLWLGFVDGELAIASWTRGAEQSQSYFVPLTSGCTLIWETVTLPEFRGKGLLPAMMDGISVALFASADNRAYGSCRDYNLASIRGLERSGFKQLGIGIQSRSGRLVWRPRHRSKTLQ